jgi:uncharacterized membrane protein required for colicin V production
MNIWLVIIVILAIAILMWFMTHGFKRGLGAAVASLYYLSKLIDGFLNLHFSGVISALIMLAVTVVLYKVFHLFFSAVNIIVKAPVISWIDKAFGLIIGLAEGFVFLYGVQFLMEHYLLK